MSDILVYTAVFGDYDAVLPPKNPEDNVDYVCVTDDPKSIPNPWETHEFTPPSRPYKRYSAKLKILPHRYFTGYKFNVWVDANIQICGNISELIKYSLGEGRHIATPPHPNRICIYDEARECVQREKAEAARVRKQVEKYRRWGFPEDYGLSWTCIILREHANIGVTKTMEVWWDQFKQETNRDQLSFEVSRWITNIDHNYIDLDPGSDSGIFLRHNHKPSGFLGELWEACIRRKAKQSGRSSSIYHALSSIIYYIKSIEESYHRKGVFGAGSEIRSFLSRKLTDYKNNYC